MGFRRSRLRLSARGLELQERVPAREGREGGQGEAEEDTVQLQEGGGCREGP